MSESSRPYKRIRTAKNVFVNFEAGVGSGSDDKDDDVLEMNDRTGNRVNNASEEHKERNKVGEYAAHFSLYQTIWRASNETSEDDAWRNLLHRAKTRSQLDSRFCIEDDAEDDCEDNYQLQENDILWEIGCKVGYEETVAFNILRRSLHPTMPDVLARSVVATSIPGRVYAEVADFTQAMKLAQSVAELDPSRIVPVPRDEILTVLNGSSSGHPRQHWVTVGAKKKWWRLYAGDTGLIEVFEGSKKKFLALLPRLSSQQVDARFGRPPQALVDRMHLQGQVGNGAIKDDLHGRYTWQGHLFSAEGLLLIDLDDIDILPSLNTTPTSAEFALFQSTTLLSPQTVENTALTIHQTRLKVGDRVKVVMGEYVGMLGEILEIIGDSEVVIYLPSQDLTESVPKNTVRAMFRVGDLVKILDGQHSGLTGWIVGVYSQSVRVVNIEEQIEVDALLTDVEFHSPMHIVSLKSRTEYPAWGTLGGKNPNDVFVGKRVMVIGMQQMKGYKGRIKTTTPDGQAFVEFDARLQQPVPIPLDDLATLNDNDIPTSCLTSRGGVLSIPLASALSTSSATPPTIESMASTPAWDHSSHTQLNQTPAWDPSSRTPAWDPNGQPPSLPVAPSRPTHWLEHPGLHGMRIKLKHDNSAELGALEFMGVENDQVRVRDKAEFKFIPFSAVEAFRPTGGGELVTVMVGPSQGTVYKVYELKDNKCVVRRPGIRPSKKHPDLTFDISELVQVFPPVR